MLSAFKKGELLIVSPTLYQSCSPHLDNMRELGINDMILIADEADALYTNYVTTEDDSRCISSGDWERLTLRERLFYGFNGKNPQTTEEQQRLVSTLVQVSATHLRTMTMAAAHREPFYGYSMDLGELRERGYSLYPDLKPMCSDGEEVSVLRDF